MTDASIEISGLSGINSIPAVSFCTSFHFSVVVAPIYNSKRVITEIEISVLEDLLKVMEIEEKYETAAIIYERLKRIKGIGNQDRS